MYHIDVLVTCHLTDLSEIFWSEEGAARSLKWVAEGPDWFDLSPSDYAAPCRLVRPGQFPIIRCPVTEPDMWA